MSTPETNEKLIFETESSKIWDINILELLLKLPDEEVDEYYKRYCKEFSPSAVKGGKHPFTFSIDYPVFQEILKMEKDFIHLIFTEIEGDLDILLSSSDGKKYFVTQTKTIKPVPNFDELDKAFQKGLYANMNNVKKALVNSIGGDNSYGNTTEVVIPTSIFGGYNEELNNSSIVFLPAVITRDKFNSVGKSKKGHLTLILSIPEIRQGLIPSWRLLPVYEDEFCNKPPGC